MSDFLLPTAGTSLKEDGQFTEVWINFFNEIVDTFASDGSLTLGDITLNNLTASRLTASDSSKKVVSVLNLALWVLGTSSEIEVTDNGDGTITVGLPDDVTITNDLTVSNDLVVENDATIQNDLTVENDAEIQGLLSVTDGVGVDDFSNDPTMADESQTALITEYAYITHFRSKFIDYDETTVTEDSDENVIEVLYKRSSVTKTTETRLYNGYGHISSAVFSGEVNKTLIANYASDNKTFTGWSPT